MNGEETWQETSGGNMQPNGTDNALRSHPLGEPLTIDEVANFLGCSSWTVRQRYLRQGIPYLQARPRGKIVFFREQVVAWIEKRQRQKGGIVR